MASQRDPNTKAHLLSGYGSGLFIAVLAVGLQVLIRPWLGSIYLILLYPAVFVIARYCGFGPALLGVGFFAFSDHLLFREPIYSLRIKEVDDLLHSLTFALLGTWISWQIHRSQLDSLALVEAESEARESRERYQLAISAAHLGVWQRDLLTNITECDATVQKHFGFNPGTFSASFDEQIQRIHPEDRQKVLNTYDHAVRSRQDYHCVYRVIWPDGTLRWIESRGRPFYDRVGAPVRMIGMMNEVSENKKKEEQLKEALLARDSFLSLASHELKTPVTSLLLQLQLAKRRMARDGMKGFGPDRVQRLIENTNQQCERISHLVEDMLDISRIQNRQLAINPEKLDLGMLVSDVVEQFGDLIAQTGCSIELKLKGDLWGEWDRNKIEQIMSNLITNALHYGAGKPIEISVVERGPDLEIRVHDHGKGIAKPDHERIFGRYERAKGSDVRGLGLGLYIVRNILNTHGGTVRVESELGKGANFVVSLPRKIPISNHLAATLPKVAV